MRCEVIYLKDRFPVLGEEGKNPRLVAYVPDAMLDADLKDRKRPCILICPGGGYCHVSDREAEPIALHFLPEGYNVFVLTYSVSPHTFPTQLREVAAAMELIHETAAQWQSDTKRIAIMGFSAGGHLAAHYTNAYHIPQVREIFPGSKPVQASILCYPVITADPACCHPGSFCSLIGHDYPLSQEELDQFSCDRLVTSHTPPAFLWHTAEDGCVPVQNSLLYAQALARHKVPFGLHVYPAGHHGLATVDELTNTGLDTITMGAKDWLHQAKIWLKDNL